MKIFISLCIFIISLICNAYAGPFGTNMGDKPDSYDLDEQSSFNDSGSKCYKVKNINKPHSDIKIYTMCFNSTGLSKVGGTTGIINSKYTAEKIYNDIKSQLTDKYGKYSDKKTTVSRPTNIVFDNYFWALKDNKDNISSIALSMTKNLENEYMVLIWYTYTNYNEYKPKDQKNISDEIMKNKSNKDSL